MQPTIATGHRPERNEVRDQVKARYPIAPLLASLGIETRGKQCRCPQPGGHANGDGNPSASVYPDHIYCNVCRKRFDVFNLYQLVHGCDFPDAVRRMSEELHLDGPVPRALKREKAEADDPVTHEAVYRNADGDPVVLVTRHDRSGAEKTFRQWRFSRTRPAGALAWRDSGEGGGWILGLGGIVPPLYRLPDLLAADPADWVVIPEGERHVDELRRLDFIATCNAMGAGKWRPEYREHLRGRRVVVLPDNDDPGRNHGEQVAASVAGTAAEVHVLALPNLPLKGDVLDWLKAGGTVEELDQLMEAAPPWVPSGVSAQAAKPRALILRMSDVAREEVRWLWPGRIPLGCLTLVEADPGMGKSTFTLRLAAAVSRGAMLVGDGDNPPLGDVVLLNAEDDLGRTVRPRLEEAGADLVRVHAITGISVPGTDGGERELTLDDVSVLEEAMARVGPALVIVDPIQAYLGADVDSYRANEVRPRLKALARLAVEHEAAVVIVRHLGKGTAGTRFIHRGLGSVDFAAAARSMLLIARHPADKDDGGRRVLLHTKSNLSPLASALWFTISDSGWTWDVVVDVRESDVIGDEARTPRRGPGRPPEECKEAEHWLAAALANGPRLVREVKSEAEVAGHSERTLDRAATQLKVVRTRGLPGQPWTWQLPVTSLPDGFWRVDSGETQNHQKTPENAQGAVSPKPVSPESNCTGKDPAIGAGQEPAVTVPAAPELPWEADPKATTDPTGDGWEDVA